MFLIIYIVFLHELTIEALLFGNDTLSDMQNLQIFKSINQTNRAFYPLMSTFSTNIIEAVYSKELTTGPDGAVVSQPYFTLVQRSTTKEADKIELLNEQLDTVKRRFVILLK